MGRALQARPSVRRPLPCQRADLLASSLSHSMQLRRAGDHLPHPRRAPPFVHATERRRVQASDARPDEQQQRCVRFATLLLPEELRQRALDTPRYVTSRRCWIAGSRRADSNSGHNDGNRGRLGLSRRESLVSMRAPALGTRRRFSGGLGPHQAHFDRRFQARVQAPENKKFSNHAGLRHGETRTRTGDTTIFSRAVRKLESAEKSCKQRTPRIESAMPARTEIPFVSSRFGRRMAPRLPLQPEER
jgi:hypothetical protein